MNKRFLCFVFLIFILWQVFIGGLIFFSDKYIPSSLQYVYTEKKIVNPIALWNRANFDGIHYLDIARKGYGIYQQAFFPLYPGLINRLTPFFGNKDLVVSFSISFVSLFLALIVFYKLLKLDYKEKIARRTIIFLLFFPTAFFFSMIYAESLFFFLIISSFYFARTKKWWLAGIFGGLASSAGLAGIFLLPALAVELWQQKRPKNNLSFVIRHLSLVIIPFGLVWHMRFLQINFGDPLMFLRAQQDKIILLYRVFWRYLKMLLTVEKMSLTYFVVVLESLAGLGFLGLLGLAYQKKIRLSYLVFASFAYIAPTLTGTFSSMPRYVLTCFPCFIMMALIKSESVKSFLLAFYLLLLIVCTFLFANGYWVA